MAIRKYPPASLLRIMNLTPTPSAPSKSLFTSTALRADYEPCRTSTQRPINTTELSTRWPLSPATTTTLHLPRKKALLAATPSTHTFKTAETPKPPPQTCAAPNSSSKATACPSWDAASPTRASSWLSCRASMRLSENSKLLLTQANVVEGLSTLLSGICGGR